VGVGVVVRCVTLEGPRVRYVTFVVAG
jgi:hypothetical protein